VSAPPTPAGDPEPEGQATGGVQSNLINPLNAGTFEELITDILDAVVQLGAIFLVLALVWTGFLFVQAQGSEDKIKQAREALFWSVAGGLILLGASAISLAIKGFVGAL
jgi:hypothetical protein